MMKKYESDDDCKHKPKNKKIRQKIYTSEYRQVALSFSDKIISKYLY